MSISAIGTTIPQARTAETKPHKTTLDQGDFLALMAAQLKNQDPTKPVDNTEYVAQMAQFSTVNGIAETNNGIAETNRSLTTIAAKLDALIAAQTPKE
jgi:flagellar basal-body rod modification protein FlgD